MFFIWIAVYWELGWCPHSCLRREGVAAKKLVTIPVAASISHRRLKRRTGALQAMSHTHTHTHTHTQCKTTIFPLATWKVLQRNHTLIEAQVKPSTSMTWRSCQVWLQTTTVKQGSRYGESHQFSGFPVHIKVLLTLRCSLLRAQWHHAYVYTWLSPFAVHPDPSQQCLLTGYLKTKKKSFKRIK